MFRDKLLIKVISYVNILLSKEKIIIGNFLKYAGKGLIILMEDFRIMGILTDVK